MKISEQSDQLQTMHKTDKLQTMHESNQVQATTEIETEKLQATEEGEHTHPNLLPESIESDQESEQPDTQRGIRKLKQLRKALHERVNLTKDSLNTVGDRIKARGKHIQTISESIAISGKEQIRELHTSLHEQSQQSLKPVNQKILEWI